MKKSMKKCIKKVTDLWTVFSWKIDPKWRLRGAQMETKSKEFRENFATPSQDPSRGGFWEGSGWIWGGFWEGFGRLLNEFLGPFSNTFCAKIYLKVSQIRSNTKENNSKWNVIFAIFENFWVVHWFGKDAGFSAQFGKDAGFSPHRSV